MKSSSSIDSIDDPINTDLKKPLTKDPEQNDDQSNHFSYTTRSSVAKRQQQLAPPNTHSYSYASGPSTDMQPFYNPSSTSMNNMPYSSSGQQVCCPPNGTDPMPCTGNLSSNNRRH